MTVKNLIVLAAMIGASGWYFTKHRTAEPQPLPLLVERDSANFRCEGKTHCSQMVSCDEATFYLKNCPGTKMDGDDDGIPCESQHCGN